MATCDPMLMSDSVWHECYKRQQLTVGYLVIVAQLWRWDAAIQVRMNGGEHAEYLGLGVQIVFVLEIGHPSY